MPDVHSPETCEACARAAEWAAETHRPSVCATDPKRALAHAMWEVRRAIGVCRDHDYHEGVEAGIAARDLIDKAQRSWAAKMS